MKKSIVVFIGLSFVIVFTIINCKEASKKNVIPAEILESPAYQEGLSLVNQNCVTCHTPKGGRENRLAPPLIAVKQHYLEEAPTQEAFVDQMTDFILGPKIENSKMPNAIKKFGLMLNLGFSEKQARAAATYLYLTDIENPKWYEEHHKEEEEKLLKFSDETTKKYVKKGMSIALATKGVLGKNLSKAIQETGTSGAIEFCNKQAKILMDSMSNELNASIKRVSDKQRNPDHLTNASELAYIQQAKNAIELGKSVSPKLIENEHYRTGYFPITVDKMCLRCHGDRETDIDFDTYSTIQKLYPLDKAIGYMEKDLRGIWVIQMAK